jgi:hypothetical protein
VARKRLDVQVQPVAPMKTVAIIAFVLAVVFALLVAYDLRF